MGVRIARLARAGRCVFDGGLMASDTKGERSARYSCSTVMKAAGISRNALFNYERHGAVSPQRDENGYRMYSQGDLLDVMCLTMLVSMGYTVREASDLLKGDDLMGVGNIDAYMARLTVQRDIIQAKLDNLVELRRITVEALPQAEAPFDLVEAPDWLFFFDEHESGNLAEARHDNQVELMRSLPLSCRGFVLQGFFEGAGDGGQGLRYRWASTLRCSHKDLLSVDATRACVLGGLCVRVAIRATYPDMDPDGVLCDRLCAFMGERGLRRIGDPFVPLLFSSRRPSSVFELFVPVECSL